MWKFILELLNSEIQTTHNLYVSYKASRVYVDSRGAHFCYSSGC